MMSPMDVVLAVGGVILVTCLVSYLTATFAVQEALDGWRREEQRREDRRKRLEDSLAEAGLPKRARDPEVIYRDSRARRDGPWR